MMTDGIFGPQTKEAVSEFQRRHDLPVDGIPSPITQRKIKEVLRNQKPPWVLILQPSLEREKYATRGARIQGINLEELYLSYGLRVKVIENAVPYQIEGVVADRPPEFIHVIATMKESPTRGEVYLDFAGESGRKSLKGRSELDVFSAYAWSILFKSLPTYAPRPTIILDVPRPPGLTETLRQLFLRNAFAHNLFQLGNTSAVLATGLGNDRIQKKIDHTLIEAYAEGYSVGDIANKIRNRAKESHLSNEDKLAFIGTALFTNDPTILLN